MPLESATYINGLNASNPTGADTKAEGDDHIRLIKSAVKATFPNLTGAVTADQSELNILDGATLSTAELNLLDGVTASTAELNLLDGVTATTTEINYIDGVTSPIQTQFADIQTQFAGKADITGETYTGAHNFTGATITAATQTTGATGNAVATLDFVNNTALSTSLPGMAGSSLKYLRVNAAETASEWAEVDTYRGRVVRTSNTALTSDDIGKLIDITSGTFTQTFTAATTLGAKWWCYLRNSGTGDITIDPNGSELIDGLTSYVMYPGETRLVTCDGTGFYTIVITGYYRTFTATGTWVKPPGYAAHSGFIWGGGGGGTCSNGTYSGGGGGGACTPFTFSSASLVSSVTVSIGAGGSGGGAGSSGATGGASVFNGVYAYGGGGSYLGNAGGGGGSLGAGASTNGVNKGGDPANSPTAVGYPNSDGFGGGAGTSDQTVVIGGSAAYGGGGGGLEGGHSLHGGAGGGGGKPPGAAGAGGIALFGGGNGGDGLYGVTSGAAGNGTAPGGGGGTCSGSSGSAVGGNGARGELRIWGVL